MRSSSLSLALLPVLVAACGSPTAPAVRHVVAITSIQTPAHAAATDTLWISFDAIPGCDTGFVIATEYMQTGMRFAASSVSTPGPCMQTMDAPDIYISPRVYAIVPPHPSPFVARFAEPGGTDSVRTIGP